MPAATEAEIEELLGPDPAAPLSLGWEHQVAEFEAHKDTRARALFWSMRTGKSKAIVDKFCYQFGKGAIGGAVIIAPNGVHLNWVVNEIPKWADPALGAHEVFGWETTKRADWDRIEALKNLLSHKGMKWFCLNMEAVSNPDCLKALRDFLKSVDGKFALGISEVHHFGHAGAKRTHKARQLARVAKFITMESGTPILNSPLRAYSIFKILTADGLIPESMRERAEERKARGLDGMTYEDFVQYFAEIELDRRTGRRSRGRQIKKIKEYRNLDEMRELMTPYASVVTRDQVSDMPALIRTDRLVVMSEKQRDAYMAMVSKHLVEIGDELIRAVDAGPRMMKLQQIVNGYMIDTEKNSIVDIDKDAPVYDALAEQVHGTVPGKTLIWCRYREDIRRVAARMKHEGFGPVLEFHGGIPTSQRENIRREFQENPRRLVCVGHPGAGGEGRDFSAASAIIFFSSTPNAIHVAQGEERGTLKGGTDTAIVRIRTPGTVDDRNWDIVDGKVKISDTLAGHGLRDLLRRTDV